MNQFPSNPPPPAPAALPRHSSPRRPRAGRKKGRRSPTALCGWQICVLLTLTVGVIAAYLSLLSAKQSMNALRSDRLRAAQAYENEVSRHKVKYREEITYWASVYNLDPAYVAAIIKRESDYDPYAVSHKNAKGLMQFMPDTFTWIAPKFGISKENTDAIYQPDNAIKMGCWLLNYISEKYNGDPILVACAYHAGWGNVDSWVKKYSTDGRTLTISQIPTDDTRYYAGKVLNAYAIYQQHYY